MRGAWWRQVVEPFIKPATAALIEFVNWPEAPARYLAAFGDEVRAAVRNQTYNQTPKQARPNPLSLCWRSRQN